MAARADALLVLARTAHGAVDVLLVDPRGPGVELLQTPVLGSSDAEFEVTFTDARRAVGDASAGLGRRARRRSCRPASRSPPTRSAPPAAPSS